ncbi:hypothetical protein M430DRAFT_47306 [Amorphotheca resinae ATCC 22711]|uniref:Cysteine dioxygenase n=1 Tax=Amorphotheca resinae ATCC 22711 TaxID=857342 RepID=A0A2T3BFU2_AMORE|nr:hypothetical protein M430DRAFT_47306 [Amorphotheca resinae ATCC 22711]PSS28287.1 hypothetical protein M430DRAFT_47306 [Amorphotheca resinae ATCC 22711]
MNPFKPSLARFSRSTPIASSPRTLGVATGCIAGIARNSKYDGIELKQQDPSPFIPDDFRNRASLSNHSPSHRQISDSPFTHLLYSITRSLTQTPTANLPQLTSILRSYVSNPLHWSAYAHANPSKQYTRNLVLEVPGIFNLLILVWTPGKRSAVHDHADSHCLMKILQGELVERRFAIPKFPGTEGKLKQTAKAEYGTGKVTYMSDQLGLHSIANPSQSNYAVSLHLYTPPNAAVRGCHVYDADNGSAEHVMQGAYDSVRGIVQE